jgi:DNA polymerase elongation subunit (family B)
MTLLNEDSLEEMKNNIKKNILPFYKFYNTEFQPAEFHLVDYLSTFTEQKRIYKLNKSYYDIETYVGESGEFTDPHEAEYPINAIALYNNNKNIIHIISYVTDCDVTDPSVIQKGVEDIYYDKIKENPTYKIDNLVIKCEIVKDERQLLETFFRTQLGFNSVALIGYNSSIFDDPYIFNRSIKLFGESKTTSMVSEFGVLNKFNKTFELIDYDLVDILKLYKPVGEGGGGLGRPQPNYKLHTLAKAILGITKLDLEGGFRETYLNDIILYLAYNMFDTILTFKLDERLSFLERTFNIAKYNKSTMGSAIRGRSFIYTNRNNYIYTSDNKLIRNKKFAREVLFEPLIK